MEQEAGNDNVPWSMKLDDLGHVMLLHEDGESLMVLNLGPKDAACEAMCQFLAAVDFDGC